MIQVDTSTWVDHLRVADRQLAGLLMEEAVLCHPFVAGELACGALHRRREILGLLRNIPQAPVVQRETARLRRSARAGGERSGQ